MRPELAVLELRAEADGPLQRLDARIKILATFGFVLAVIAATAVLVMLWRAQEAERERLVAARVELAEAQAERTR